jgi:ribonuclease HII
MLSLKYDESNDYEIGVDEAGRGPLFGPLYVAAVVLPKEGFNGTGIKDSKKIKNKVKLAALAAYIKEHSLAWSIQSVDHTVIDQINIRQAVFQGMHACIRDICHKGSSDFGFDKKIGLLIDGNDFKPFYRFNEENDDFVEIPYVTIEGGDNRFLAIAAASILAKNARDTYIEELCKDKPDLVMRYRIDKNMGYGTKAHLDGILEHGVTQWHRMTYNRCSSATLNPI